VTAPAGDVATRVASVRARIAAAGGEDRVRLVAMTKGFDAAAALAALDAGVADLGESYAQELLAKVPAVADERVRWHFTGHVQTNKVRPLAPIVALWQSVDRAVLGDELARRSPGAQVLVQVNVTGSSTQSGCRPAEVGQLVGRLRRSGLAVAGLMAIGPAGAPEGARPSFRQLARLADDLGLAERSMGMSDDLEVAVEEGATIVRVGRAIFGDRPHAGGARSLTS
jgi:pyridoxal phosphate enzyme (YggS family)